jgi:hypothetical protein
MSSRDLDVLQNHLDDNPASQARYAQLSDFKKEMCLRWIGEASTPDLRERRARLLVRRLWLTAFDPFFHMADVMFAELSDLYGPPQPLRTLPVAEQIEAINERRVLGAYHYRNFDDGGTAFYIVAPDDKLLDDVLLIYARPCVLTDRITGWLNRNNLETMREVRDYFGFPSADSV